MDQQNYFEEIDLAYTRLSSKALENRLRDLAEQSRTEYGADSPFYASMQSELGSFFRGQARYTEAAALFSEAIRILRGSVGSESPDYATAVMNLGSTYRLMGRFDEAESCFSESMECYRKTVGEQHILYAAALNNLSLLCLDRGDLSQAARLLHQASDILSQLPDSSDPWSVSLCNLAVLYHRLGQLSKARENLLRAVELFETELGTETPHYYAALNELGLVCCDEGHYEDACRWLEKAAAAAKQLYGTDHPEYKAICAHLRRAQAAEREGS